MKLNQQFKQIHQSSTVAISDRILALKASGRKIIPLQVGDPDFATPSAIVEAGVNALREGMTHYGPSRGFLELRTAIASRLARKSNVAEAYDPNTEILVTHGGVHAYYLAMQSILNPGDEVLIPDPSWPTHSNMIKLLRGKVISVAATQKNGFIPPITAWKSAITSKTRAIVINYPANPTGVYPSREYMQQLLELAYQHNLWVVSDEVYDNIYFYEEPVSASAFPTMKDCVIIINSLSKTYAMTGWRVGYIAAPKCVIDNALKAGQNSITCVAPFVQKAAAVALTDKDVQKIALNMRTAYARRRDIVLRIHEEFEETPVCITPPMGAFYFFLDFRSLKTSSLEICEQILDETGVGLVPGTAFGLQGEGSVRMTIAASDGDVESGFKAILNWAKRK